MERVVITWGYIPIENESETIYCGDSEASGTIELNFEIIDDLYVGLDNNFSCKCDNQSLWDPMSALNKQVARFLSDSFGLNIGPENVYGAYSLVNDEPDDASVNFELLDCEAGEFTNDDRQHNGKLFLRHYFEEDGEIFEEKICIGKGG